MQAELQEKLRHAEIEVSLERARLSRERVAMEERLRQHEQTHSQRSATTSEPPASGKPATARRWLSRLGLKDE
jgi:hypothetical protein